MRTGAIEVRLVPDALSTGVRRDIELEAAAVITANGARVTTQFPADQLYVAGSQYWTGFRLDC
jgi:hypothetical protein